VIGKEDECESDQDCTLLTALVALLGDPSTHEYAALFWRRRLTLERRNETEVCRDLSAFRSQLLDHALHVTRDSVNVMIFVIIDSDIGVVEFGVIDPPRSYSAAFGTAD